MDDDDGLRRSRLRLVAHRVLNLELAAASKANTPGSSVNDKSRASELGASKRR